MKLITIRILRGYYKLQKLVERGRIFQFLPGLNDVHNKAPVQILGKEFLPSLNNVFLSIRAEEGRKSVMIEATSTETSALAVTKPNT